MTDSIVSSTNRRFVVIIWYLIIGDGNSVEQVQLKMARINNVKTSRKVIAPIFHLQTKEENNGKLSKELIKNARQTGKLNLSGRCLNMGK